MREDVVYPSNSSNNSGHPKRLPIVFCLDVSPSMRNGNPRRIDLLNDAVEQFFRAVKAVPKAAAAAEIAYVTFSTHIEMNTEFKPLSSLSPQKLITVERGATKMASAVLLSIEKIEERRERLIDMDLGYYAPFLVLVTDGDPDGTDDEETIRKAVNAVNSHCSSHVGTKEIIVPFIIGVGDEIEHPERLQEYSSGFTKGFFHLRGNSIKTNLEKVFQLIGNSVTVSVNLNKYGGSTYLQKIKTDLDALMDEINQK